MADGHTPRGFPAEASSDAQTSNVSRGTGLATVTLRLYDYGREMADMSRDGDGNHEFPRQCNIPKSQYHPISMLEDLEDSKPLGRGPNR